VKQFLPVAYDETEMHVVVISVIERVFC